MIKKWDIVIIIILIAIAFIPTMVFSVISKRDYNGTYAEITVNGKVFKEIPLTNHKGEDKIPIKTDKGINIISIKDNEVSIIEADCPDKICIKPGYISKVGDSLVCLPHRVMVEIKGQTSDNGVILSY